MNQIAGTWNAPMDSSGRDPVVGRTEWGAPIYRSALGHTYWREPKKPGYEKNALKLRDMLAMYGDGPRKPMEYETTRQAPDGVSQPTLGGAMGGIRDMIMSGLSAPRRAMEGQPVTNGDVLNTALDWGLMSAPMSAPKGALRSGAMAADRDLFSTAEEAAELLRKEYGVDVSLTKHPTNYGNSAYVRVRVPHDDRFYTSSGFRLSDHDVGDFRKATDEVPTVIYGGDVTPESLLDMVRGSVSSGAEKAKVAALQRQSREQLKSDALSFWADAPEADKAAFAAENKFLYLRKPERKEAKALAFYRRFGLGE